MKNRSIFAAICLLVGLSAFAPATRMGSLPISTEESTVTWRGEKVTGFHTGNISIQNGTLEVEDGKLLGGQFEIDMSSITCTDLTGGSANKLVGHLKSDDFFGVETHPISTFVITKVTATGQDTYDVVGDITIKGITEEINFPATVTVEGDKVKAVAKITVDRTKFGVRYGSGSFFDNLGDKAIYDDFDLEVTLVTRA